MGKISKKKNEKPRILDARTYHQIPRRICELKAIKRRVRPGYALLYDLFNIFSLAILRKIKHFDGVKVGGQYMNINTLRFVDDTL